LIEIAVIGPDEAIRAAIGFFKFKRGLRAGDWCELSVEVPDQRATDQLLDALRRAGVSVVELRRNRQTLEEAFLNIVSAAQPQPAMIVAEAIAE
jgi:hypothetical protein